MNLHKYTLHYLIVFLVVSTVYSQEQDKRISKADESFNKFAYVNARKIYLKVAESGYESIDLLKKLGDSYYFNAELKEALPWYEKLVSKHGDDLDPEYHFRYSQSLKSAGRYDQADVVMKKFDALTGTDRRGEYFRNSPNYLELIEMNSGKFQLINLDINSDKSDYAPSFNNKGELVFATARKNKGFRKAIHRWNDKPFLDLLASSINPETGLLENPHSIKGKINTKLHESTSTFSKDGKTIYFTRNNLIRKKLGQNKEGSILLKIYKAILDGEKWGNVTELPFNSNEYSVAHPALSPDGKQLYFSSDMPGSRGLSDIYVVDINEDGTYSEPKNLGDKINTESRETFPYVSDSGRLYFASDGHLGLGGLDIFISDKDESGLYTYPINVGKPVNSGQDDFTFVLNEDTKIGYFASNRKGGKGNDDIYSFLQTEELITKCSQDVSGIITDATTKEIIADAEVVLLDDQNTILKTTKSDEKGHYFFDIDCGVPFTLRSSKATYKPTEVSLHPKNNLLYNHVLTMQLFKGENLQKKEIKQGDDLAKLLELAPIYFDFDKWNIRPDAEIELQKVIAFLKENPKLKIDIRAHTDSRSPDAYNMILSESRAQSTIQYIINKGGIDASRIGGRGYGELFLINDCVNGKECNDDLHERNRRSEFIVISY